ncbi:MAG: nucleoside triphosphate pyrophosphohydrolase [Candidatus Marsarchaeota archaeon]|jgi:predicted house-cleaning noncanonical NTP pyrophosphatase (MazG superfamily)|nr:nucleoside triphosphate pyrophosphohydrolase [Candidatus Marsarchaeota archaeon]MCL5111343.1 nucleoside triphosphate pyrophosphohydrolase [Candidatus Marsarchaeota archaeon]
MKFDKLVRDRIPEIIAKGGKRAITHVAEPEEYEKRLREKLKEESAEFYASGRVEELADTLEVIYAICEAKGIPFARLEDIRKKKAQERGPFSKRIVLDGIE